MLRRAYLCIISYRMPLTLLATKLYVPLRRPGAVPRPRLTEKLQSGLNQPGSFVLLSGPAGFGKTTLLSEYADQVKLPVAWVSLDGGDNDPSRFWRYLIAACQTVDPEIGAAAGGALGSAQPVPSDTVPTILINDLACLDRELVLILDDFHAIQDESIQEGFAFLVEHAPANLHLIISTRVDPPWPLARYRARNQLIELRADDLRFTPTEAADFLNQVMGISLSKEDVAVLEKRTEGWIAGLQLAALSMQGRRDISGFVQSFAGSHVYVAEYLVEEVLQRQPGDLQAFFLKTSILERLSAGLCEAVTGRRDAGDVLAALYRENLFITSLDDEGLWFRYHQLFGDLLEIRLQSTFSADEVAILHRSAADWYDQHGDLAGAVNHALAAKDFDGAARRIGENAYQMMTRGELATLMRWTEALPSELIWRHPPIVITRIWVLALAGAALQVEPLLKQAETQFEEDRESPISRELAGFAAAIRAFFAMMVGGDERALGLAERAESLLPESSVHARWLLPYTLGAAYRGQGRYEKAAEAFASQARMGEEHDNLVVWGTGVTAVALVRRAQGHLNETGEICRQALDRLAERGAGEFGSLAKLEVPLVEVLCEQNKLEEASSRLAGVMSRLRSWPMPTDRLHAQLALIELQEAQDDLRGALETLQKAKDLRASGSVLKNLARSLDLAEIRLALKCGNIENAEHLLDALEPGTSRWVELRDEELILLARLRLTQGRLEEADRILSSLAREAGAGERKGTLIGTLALQARILHAQGEQEAALVALIKSLALGEPEGYARVFLDEGEAMQGLLAAVARRLEASNDTVSAPSKAYVDRLLGAFPEGQTKGARQLPPTHTDELVEQLTPREIEVLQLIAAGDSNRTIAEKLVITVSAVKKHNANIYGKLNVNSRTQAVARAKQLRLLAQDE